MDGGIINVLIGGGLVVVGQYVAHFTALNRDRAQERARAMESYLRGLRNLEMAMEDMYAFASKNPHSGDAYKQQVADLRKVLLQCFAERVPLQVRADDDLVQLVSQPLYRAAKIYATFRDGIDGRADLAWIRKTLDKFGAQVISLGLNAGQLAEPPRRRKSLPQLTESDLDEVLDLAVDDED